MKKNKLTILFVALALLVNASCKEEKHVPPTWGEDKEEQNKEPNAAVVKSGWKNVEDSYGELPNYIDVYKSPESLVDKKAVAYIAIADLDKAKWDVLGDIVFDAQANGYGSKTVNTLTQFYSKNKMPIIINGGLFYYGNSFFYSQNLVYKNNTMLASNQNYFSKDWVKIWYPTIGAFGQQADNSFKVTWTYYNNNDKVNYSYVNPADNNETKAPLAIPNATFPSTGTVYSPKTAIGGIIVLLKDGIVRNTTAQEMLDVSATSNQPRTAIGVTKDNKLVLFVCEGRNVTAGVAGYTTADVANIMKNLGCVDALNLDGGGSSGMLVNGKETIKPSGGTQRAVLTAVGLQ